MTKFLILFSSILFSSDLASAAINYRCRLESSNPNETAIYTDLVFKDPTNNSVLNLGSLSKFGYSITAMTEPLTDTTASVLFQIEEPNGARTVLHTTTASSFTYGRAPIRLECSSR